MYVRIYVCIHVSKVSYVHLSVTIGCYLQHYHF